MTPSLLAAVCSRHPRVAIVGGPRTGKSTIAATVSDRPVFHSDRFSMTSKSHPMRPFLSREARAREWAEAPDRMIAATSNLDRFVVEGVMVARALRKGLQVDAVVVLHTPKVEQTPGQAAMHKGVNTVLGGLPRTVPWYEEKA